MSSLGTLNRIICAAMLVLMGAGLTVAQTTVSVNPATMRINPGGTITLDVLVSNVTQLHAAKAVVTFDNTVVQLTAVVTDGKFLASGGGTVFASTNPAPGPTVSSIEIDQAILGLGGVTGSGVLFSLTFSAVGPGTSAVTLSSVDLRDNGVPPQTIPATVESGSLTVRNPAVITVIYVSPGGSDITGDGTAGKPFLTIPKAIDVAYPLDTIRVWSGTYDEALNINKSLVLVGSGPDTTTTIEAPADFATNTAYNYSLPTFGTERTIVHVGAASPITVVIKGFNVDGRNLGPDISSQGVAYSGILAEQCNVTITGNVVKNILPVSGPVRDEAGLGRNGRGIHVRGSGSVAVITGNTLQEINRIHIMINATDNTGQLPAVFPQAVVSNNTIAGKGLYAGGQKGIWFNTGAWGEISGNIITNIDYVDPVIEPDRGSAIVVRFGYLDPAHRRIIKNNTITSATYVNNKGLYLQGTRDSVADNTITGYRWGVEIHDGFATKLARNTITGGVIGVLVATEHAPGTADSVTIGGSPADKNTITGQNYEAGGFAISLSFRDLLDNVTFQSSIPVDARYNDFGVYTAAEIAARIWDRADTTLIDGVPVAEVLYIPFFGMLTANVKVFLEGPYTAGVMSTSLRTAGLLPTGHPYAAAPWSYAGTEAVAAIPANVVDWVLVELRTSTDAASTVGRRAAFVKTNGLVVDLDGTTPVTFSDVAVGNYYVVIRHRNHLAVMTAAALSLSAASPPYDFGTGLGQYYLGDAKDLGGGVFGMWAGDADASGDVAALDRSETWNLRNQVGYYKADVDMSGDVAALDRSLTWNNRNKFTRVP